MFLQSHLYSQTYFGAVQFCDLPSDQFGRRGWWSLKDSSPHSQGSRQRGRGRLDCLWRAAAGSALNATSCQSLQPLSVRKKMFKEFDPHDSDSYLVNVSDHRKKQKLTRSSGWEQWSGPSLYKQTNKQKSAQKLSQSNFHFHIFTLMLLNFMPQRYVAARDAVSWISLVSWRHFLHSGLVHWTWGRGWQGVCW